MLYKKLLSDVIKLFALKELIRVKLSETFTDLMYKATLVTGLLPSKVSLNWRAIQRAPLS